MILSFLQSDRIRSELMTDMRVKYGRLILLQSYGESYSSNYEDTINKALKLFLVVAFLPAALNTWTS